MKYHVGRNSKQTQANQCSKSNSGIKNISDSQASWMQDQGHYHAGFGWIPIHNEQNPIKIIREFNKATQRKVMRACSRLFASIYAIY